MLDSSASLGMTGWGTGMTGGGCSPFDRLRVDGVGLRVNGESCGEGLQSLRDSFHWG